MKGIKRLVMAGMAGTLTLGLLTTCAAAKEKQIPQLIEWEGKPVMLFPLAAHITYETTNGLDRLRPNEAMADSAFAAGMPDVLKDAGLAWSIPREADLAAKPDSYSILNQTRDGLNSAAR